MNTTDLSSRLIKAQFIMSHTYDVMTVYDSLTLISISIISVNIVMGISGTYLTRKCVYQGTADK